MKKLIILDRDGVINYDTNYIKSPEEWIPIPNSLEAIALLHQAGYTVCVATNKSGIGRGFYDEQTLSHIHHKMINAVRAKGGEIDGIFYCPHLPEANCTCRKPKTGLFEQIAATHGVSLKGVPAVGDSLRDIQVAQAVQGDPILVLTGKGAKTLASHPQELASVPCYENLFAFVHLHLLLTK